MVMTNRMKVVQQLNKKLNSFPQVDKERTVDFNGIYRKQRPSTDQAKRPKSGKSRDVMCDQNTLRRSLGTF